MQNRVTPFHHLLREHQFALTAIRDIKAQQMSDRNTVIASQTDVLGQHILAEFAITPEFRHEIDTAQNPKNVVRETILKAAQLSGATILRDATFYNPASKNICGIVAVAESHFTFHYRPAEKMISVDAFTCGKIDLIKALKHIKSRVHIQPYDQIRIQRGVHETAKQEFIPGIATFSNPSTLIFFKSPLTVSNTASHGQHTIAEFYHCNAGKINNAGSVLNTFIDALKAGSATPQFSFVHEFQPQGITTVVIGEGFHLTVHDWPEHGYAAIDFCVFDKKIDREKVIRYIADHFDARKTAEYTFPRGNFDITSGAAVAVFDEVKATATGLKM